MKMGRRGRRREQYKPDDDEWWDSSDEGEINIKPLESLVIHDSDDDIMDCWDHYRSLNSQMTYLGLPFVRNHLFNQMEDPSIVYGYKKYVTDDDIYCGIEYCEDLIDIYMNEQYELGDNLVYEEKNSLLILNIPKYIAIMKEELYKYYVNIYGRLKEPRAPPLIPDEPIEPKNNESIESIPV